MNVARKQFFELLKKIVQIAELQTAYLAVDECLKITNRRVNALEFIVVPRIEYVVKYIFTELEERSKEDKFKIKKILQVKKTAQERQEEEESNENQQGNEETNLVSEFDDGNEDDDEIEEDERLFS